MDDTGPPAEGSIQYVTNPGAAVPENVIELRVNEALLAARKNSAEIMAMCQTHRCPELAAKLIEEGVSPDGAARRILDHQAAVAQQQNIVAADVSAVADKLRHKANLAQQLEEAGQARFEAQRKAYPPWS